MKVINLLNKIANNEEVPKKINHRGLIYKLEYKNTVKGSYDYQSETGTYLLSYLSQQRYLTDILEEEVEIIEEKPKKIEEINKSYPIFNFDEKSFDAMKDMLQDVYSKQVEVIKAVNYLLEKENDK